MKVARTGPRTFLVEFESEEEIREEHRSNFSQGGLRLPVAEKLALFSTLEVTLRWAFGGEVPVKGTVVAPLPDGAALSIEGDADAILQALLVAPAAEAGLAKTDRSDWERLRSLPRMQKLLLAPKADRTERLVLVQDNDPQVLYALLKNRRPRTRRSPAAPRPAWP